MTLLEIGKKWEAAVQIKSRCHNVTTREMGLIKDLVNSFNEYMNRMVIVRVSACELPYICDTVARQLLAEGLIEKRFDTKLKKSAGFYEF